MTNREDHSEYYQLSMGTSGACREFKPLILPVLCPSFKRRVDGTSSLKEIKQEASRMNCAGVGSLFTVMKILPSLVVLRSRLS